MLALALSLSSMYDPAVIPTTPSTAPDEALLRAFREARDEAALDALIRRHWERVHRIAARIVRDPAQAEDAAQQAFVTLARDGAGGFRGDGPLAAWLAQVAVNEARKALRSRKRRGAHEEAAGRRGGAGGGPGAGGPGRRDSDVAVALESHLERLEEDLRVPLLLHYAEGMTHAEVAAALDVPQGTAASRLRRGVEALRAALAGAGYASAIAAPGALEDLLRRLPPPACTPEAPGAAVVLVLASKAATKAALSGALAAALAASVLVAAAYLVVGSARAGRPPVRVAAATSPASGASAEAVAPGAPAPPAPEAPADAPAASGAGAPAVASAPVPVPAAKEEADDDDDRPLVTGTVLSSADGSPVAGATVILTMQRGVRRSYAHGMTGPAGEIRVPRQWRGLRVLEDGRVAIGDEEPYTHFSLVVHHPDMAPLAAVVEPADIAARRPQALRMDPGGLSLEAIVLDDLDAPVPGKRVTVRQSLPIAAPHSAEIHSLRGVVTGADGVARLRGLAPGRAQVEVSLESSISPERRDAVVPPGGGGPRVEFRVLVAARLSVEVVDAGGHAVIGATVEVANEGEARAFYQAGSITGPTSLGAHPPGVYEVRAGRAEERMEARERVVLERGASRLVRIVLPDDPAWARAEAEQAGPVVAGRVGGRVVAEDGRPVKGARVSLEGLAIPRAGLAPGTGWRDWPREVFVHRDGVDTGPDGAFAFDGLPVERLLAEVTVEAKGYGRRRLAILPDPAALDEGASCPPPEPGAERVPVEARKDRLAVRLEEGIAHVVLIRPPEGRSAQDLAAYICALATEVRLPGTERRSSSSGNHVSGLSVTPDGRVRFALDGERGEVATIALHVAQGPAIIVAGVEAGGAPVEVDYEGGPGGAAEGRVIAPDGKPARGASVSLLLPGAESAPALEPWCVRSAKDGSFRIEGLPLGRARLRVSLEGAVEREVEVAAEAGETAVVGEVKMVAER